MTPHKIRQRATGYMVASFFLCLLLLGGAFFMFNSGYHGTAWLWFGLGVGNAYLFWFNKRIYDRHK